MADDGEREGGNKGCERACRKCWADGTGVDAVIVCEYPSTSRYIAQLQAHARRDLAPMASSGAYSAALQN